MAEEFPILARRIGVLKVSTILIVLFVLVLIAEVGLSEVTPGPLLTPRRRVVTAIFSTVVFVAGWTMIQAIRSVGFNPLPPESPPRRD